MPETCKIDGQIEEVERLIRENKNALLSLVNRLEGLKKEKELISDPFRQELVSHFGDRIIHIDNYNTDTYHVYFKNGVYKYDKDHPFKVIGIEEKSNLDGKDYLRIVFVP